MRHTATRLISDERILGSSEFVEMVLKSANEAYERKAVIQAQGINLDQQIGIVAAQRSLRCLSTEFDTVCGQQVCKPRASGNANQRNCQTNAYRQFVFSRERRLESNLLSV
jgi:hypothetical protein